MVVFKYRANFPNKQYFFFDSSPRYLPSRKHHHVIFQCFFWPTVYTHKKSLLINRWLFVPLWTPRTAITDPLGEEKVQWCNDTFREEAKTDLLHSMMVSPLNVIAVIFFWLTTQLRLSITPVRSSIIKRFLKTPLKCDQYSPS